MSLVVVGPLVLVSGALALSVDPLLLLMVSRVPRAPEVYVD